ncbi:acyl-CoA N-acyltransferase [Crassisporium funariophilum]|nr:acyl-CoA N-acyltransferase [Crassisporium funariophilum]
MFTTARLRLRGHKPTDNESLLALYNDPLVAPWINEGFVVPKHHSFLDRITTFLDSALMMCIVEEIETGEFVGLTGFVAQAETKNRNAVMMIALMPKFHRKGYGYEAMRWLIGYAFEGMNMHRVSLTVFEGNDKALALYLKLGFIEEGRHRKIVWIDGAWKDTIYMGILEDEWPGLKTREVHSI